VKTAEKKTTGTGKDKIAVRFSVTSGPSEGKSVFNDFVISPDNGTALGFFFRHMKALGLGTDYFASNPDLTKVAADLVGRNCVVVVGIRQWNEEDRNEIKGIKPSGSAASTAGPVAGPQPTAQPQPTATRPQPAPQAQPQPAPAAAKKAEPPKKAEKAEPVVEATPAPAPAPTPEPEDAAPAAENDTVAPAKPNLPF